MRKFAFLFSLLLVCLISFSQQTPKGMKYQGVARDLKGNVLSDQKITLRITLAVNNTQQWKNYYVESHELQTNQLGLFTLVVGEGRGQSGKFEDVPWSTEDIWMEVSIRDNSGYATISNSKLLAVPYAFHALTANKLVGSPLLMGGTITGGTGSNSWQMGGNTSSNPNFNALGITDNADLNIITNNITRLLILANGNVQIARSLAIGANLNVDSSVNLNNKSGSTINNGPFKVNKVSPTWLTGTLQVDKSSTLNDSLFVTNNKPTSLSGTLNVDMETHLRAALITDGPTDLNSSLNVNNTRPTKLTGTLQVDKITTLNDSFFVTNNKPSVFTGKTQVNDSSSYLQRVLITNQTLNQDTGTLTPNGALQVAGGAGIGGNLTVGGSARIGGGMSLASLKVTGGTESVSDSTGALVVSGGTGIKKQLNVGGNAGFGGTAMIAGATTINNSLTVNGGNLQITGGASGSKPLVVTGTSQGVQINLGANANSSNNFITFKSGTTTKGSIKAQTVDEVTSDPLYAWDITVFSANIAKATIDMGLAAADLYGAATDARACAGFGVVVCPPGFGVIATKVVMLAAKVVGVVGASTQLSQYISQKRDHAGVIYSSGSADYAEWLPKSSPKLDLYPGQVVGLHHGVISLSTANADRLLVISTNPVVLGNVPAEGKEGEFAKTAFVGQVPVRVVGRVTEGDYILSSGKHDGKAIAKHPQDVSMDDALHFVGIAWSSSEIVEEKPVNVGVGISNNDVRTMIQSIQTKVESQTAEINLLKKQINNNNQLLAKLVPGFKPNFFTEGSMNVASNKNSAPKTEVNSSSPVASSKLPEQQTVLSQPSILSQVPNFNMQTTQQMYSEMRPMIQAQIAKPESERAPQMTDAFIEKLLQWGVSTAGNSDITKDLISKMNADPALKKSIYETIKVNYAKGVEQGKEAYKY